ncbi:type IV toxin-antitoxin system AbiEi family antitoxin domain-containing protein [Actinomarinicola tropica]|nr:type IV toxin-antitoxin system AbiEi family antitoxin domain-containing protein [Actinomarinicola tropica]
MRPTIRRAIAERAQEQFGLVTRPQLVALGVDPGQVHRLVRTSHLERRGRHTFAIAGAPRSYEQSVLAACLDTGGVASHRTAARLHRLEGFRSVEVVEVTVGRRLHHAPLPDITVHTSTNLPPDDVLRIGAIPAVSAARTFFGLAALVPDVSRTSLRTALDTAARDGLVSDAWLWWRLEQLRCRGRNGIAEMELALRERQRLGPTESWLERRFLELLEGAGLPLPTVQRRVRHRGNSVARVDMSYDPLDLVIELDGHASHSTRAQRDRDERRRNRLVLAGLRLLVFTYDHVVRSPREVVEVVEAGLAAATAGRSA